jgi:phage gp46-like protein
MTSDVKVFTVKRETLVLNNPGVRIAAVKQEAAYAQLAASVEISAVKHEAMAIYITPTIQISGLKQEVLAHYSNVSRVVGIKQEVLLSNAGDVPIIPPIPPDPPKPLPNTFHPLNIPCIPPPRSRFRRFWATQPNVCPSEPGQCNYTDPNNLATDCEKPGLQLLVTIDPAWEQLTCAYDGKGGLPDCAPPITGATINTENYVQGLVLNILGTNAAQAPSICGNIPGQRLGYWLDSIAGNKSGSSIRYVPTLGFTTAQAVQFIQMQADADLKKLIQYGVANSVTVTASYVGNGTIALKIVVEGVDDTTTVVNSTMTKITNAWVWNK